MTCRSGNSSRVSIRDWRRPFCGRGLWLQKIGPMGRRTGSISVKHSRPLPREVLDMGHNFAVAVVAVAKLCGPPLSGRRTHHAVAFPVQQVAGRRCDHQVDAPVRVMARQLLTIALMDVVEPLCQGPNKTPRTTCGVDGRIVIAGLSSDCVFVPAAMLRVIATALGCNLFDREIAASRAAGPRAAAWVACRYGPTTRAPAPVPRTSSRCWAGRSSPRAVLRART